MNTELLYFKVLELCFIVNLGTHDKEINEYNHINIILIISSLIKYINT